MLICFYNGYYVSIFVLFYLHLKYKSMTNKSYFNSLCGKSLNLGSFIVKFDSKPFDPEFLRSCLSKTSVFTFFVFHEKLPAPLFSGSVIITPRCIHTNISYYKSEICKYSPWELHEWCPAIFCPWTNYFHWSKYMRIALEIFVESNPLLNKSLDSND